jgi:hypothetical protein
MAAETTTNVVIDVEGHMRVPISATIKVLVDHPGFETWREENPDGDSDDWREEITQLALDTFEDNKDEILEEAYWDAQARGDEWASDVMEWDDAEGEVVEGTFHWNAE